MRTTVGKRERKLIFFGTSDFSVPSLTALGAEGFNIVGVVTKPDQPAGRGKMLAVPAVAKLASDNNMELFQPQKFKDIKDQLAALSPDAGVVVAYGKIIPQSVIDLFPLGLINAHASLLPKYRGPAPIEAAILAGDKQTGVSLMQIDAGMDTGPVYAKESIKLSNKITRPELYNQLSQLAAKMLVQYLPDILSGKLGSQPQNNEEASVVAMIKKEDGMIDWQMSATDIERQIRAYLGWPGSRTDLGGRECVVTHAHLTPNTVTGKDLRIGQAFRLGNTLAVSCGKGVLIIDRLRPAGKPEMTAQAFLAGNKLEAD